MTQSDKFVFIFMNPGCLHLKEKKTKQFDMYHQFAFVNFINTINHNSNNNNNRILNVKFKKKNIKTLEMSFKFGSDKFVLHCLPSKQLYNIYNLKIVFNIFSPQVKLCDTKRKSIQLKIPFCFTRNCFMEAKIATKSY